MSSQDSRDPVAADKTFLLGVYPARSGPHILQGKTWRLSGKLYGPCCNGGGDIGDLVEQVAGITQKRSRLHLLELKTGTLFEIRGKAKRRG